MKPQIASLNATELMNEIADASLGDERLNARFVQIMKLIAHAPSKSFSAMCETEEEREGFYRFMRNPRIDYEDVLRPHADETIARANETGKVLVLHDSSTFRVSDNAEINSYISTGKKGFLAHVALVLDGRKERKPLGVAGMDLLFRDRRNAKTKRNGRSLSGAETAKLTDREYDRWLRLHEQTDKALQGIERIHVMDREADCYALLSQMSASGGDFVVRWRHNRKARLNDETSPQWTSMRELVENAPSTKFQRTIHIGKRRAKSAPRAAKAAPARDSRVAHLRFSCCSVRLRKPRYLDDTYPDELPLQVVRVFEPAPPENEEPIEWILLTSLPVDTRAQIECVVDIYRQRWLIEEFFKALKSGCGYRQRPLINKHSIVNALATFMPVAWKVLLLRQVARTAESSARCALTKTELEVLKAKAKQIGKPLPHKPTAQQALLFVANLGGYRKHSKSPPGCKVLMRGMDFLCVMVQGWELAKM